MATRRSFSFLCVLNPSTSVTGQPSGAEASIIRRRLKVYPFRTRIPKLEPKSPYCGSCFAELVCQYGTPLVHQAP